MVVFTMLTMYIGCDTLHDVLRPGTFPPSVSGVTSYFLPVINIATNVLIMFISSYMLSDSSTN